MQNIPFSKQDNFLSLGVWSAVANVWFLVWAIRHRGELDRNLDPTTKIIRWFIVGICLVPAIQLPQYLNPPVFRLIIAIIGLAFLVWPNFADYLTRILRRLKLLPRSSGEEQQLDHP